MKKQFVTYEIALKLKELGFDEPCICGYNSYGALKNNLAMTHGELSDYISTDKYDVKVNAPLYQQVIDWFREKYNLNIIINANSMNSFTSMIYELDEDSCLISIIPYKQYSTYYEAREQVILKIIEIIKDGKEN